MSKRAAVFLYVTVGWTLWVWSVLIRNMMEDHVHTFSFRAVHITLAIISITFAAITWRIVYKLRKKS
jgi:hypothetical protein